MELSSNESFPELLARIRQGDDDAAAVVFQRYVNQLAAKARHHLSPAVRRQIDAEDIVQSVYRTFFRRVQNGQFQLDHWGSIWGLLARITICKCARTVARIKNRPSQESLKTSADSSTVGSNLDWEAIAREPSPAEVAVAADILDTLLKTLPESHREILTLTLEGFTQVEIVNRLGCSERTIRRVLVHVESNLVKLDASEE